MKTDVLSVLKEKKIQGWKIFAEFYTLFTSELRTEIKSRLRRSPRNKRKIRANLAENRWYSV